MDINVHRRNKLIKENITFINVHGMRVPLFAIFEINVCGLCNRKCSFCPRATYYPNTKEYLSIKLWEKVVKEVASLQFNGVFLLSAFSEPLMHPELDQIIAIAKMYCPKCKVEVVTNGDFLTERRLKSLYETGVDTTLISLYDGAYQVDKFNNMRKKSGIAAERIVLRKRYTTGEFNKTNRGGLVDEGVRYQLSEYPLIRECYLPCYTLLMDYDGLAYICTHDWGKKLCTGNLSEQSVVDVWIGKIMMSARFNLINKNRAQAPCNVCNADGTLVGKEYAALWKKLI